MNSPSGNTAAFGDVPSPEMIRSMVARGRPVTFPLPPSVDHQQARAAARELERLLAAEPFYLAVPITSPVSLTVTRLIDEDEARRLHGELEAMVAEFRSTASRLIGQFREHVEPAYERGEDCPDELDVDGQTWWLHIHGDHCRFESAADGTVVEALIARPDELDPYFLLIYAETSGRHEGVHAACPAGFHDMDRMLTFADLTR